MYIIRGWSVLFSLILLAPGKYLKSNFFSVFKIFSHIDHVIEHFENQNGFSVRETLQPFLICQIRNICTKYVSFLDTSRTASNVKLMLMW